MNAKTFLVIIAVMFSALCATLWLIDRNQASQEIKLTMKTDQGDFPGGELKLTRAK